MFEELTLIICLATPNISPTAVIVERFLLNILHCFDYFVTMKLINNANGKGKSVKVIRSCAREVIFKVFQRCFMEYQAGHVLWDLDDLYGRTASMTGMESC